MTNLALSVWHRAYLTFLVGRNVPLSMAIEMAESVTETAEDPAAVAQRHIEEDLSSQL